jgi:hypothetical protein
MAVVVPLELVLLVKVDRVVAGIAEVVLVQHVKDTMVPLATLLMVVGQVAVLADLLFLVILM